MMELTSDAITYGVNITTNVPSEYSERQTIGTLLCIYFTMIVTATEYESPADGEIWDFSRMRALSKELLEYAVIEQADNDYRDVFGRIWKRYADARGGASKPGIERDWLYVVDYLSNDFRFRKLSTLLYSQFSVAGNFPRIDFNTTNRLVADRYLRELFPRLPLADQKRLKADYFKLIEQDTARDDKQQLPLVMQPQTQRLGLFVNASPRIYGSYTPGGAAFFAYNLTGSIPPGARGASVQYRFTTDINTAIDQPEDWPSLKITLDGYSIYGSPRMGVASSTLLVRPILTATNVASSYIPIPQNNVWYNAIRNNTRLQTIPSADILNICRNSVQSYYRSLAEFGVFIESALTPSLVVTQEQVDSATNAAAGAAIGTAVLGPLGTLIGGVLGGVLNTATPVGLYFSNGFEIKSEAEIGQQNSSNLAIIDKNITTRALLTHYQELSLLRF